MPRSLACDVLVVGGGCSGTAAAISALRMGARVVLVEPSPWVGGMLTAAGVSAVDGNHHLPSGIWAEFRDRLRHHYGGADVLASGWISHTLFEPHVGQRILRRLLFEAAAMQVCEIHGAAFSSSENHVPFGRTDTRHAQLHLVLGYRTVCAHRQDSRLTGADAVPVPAADGKPHEHDQKLTIRAGVTIAADEYGDFLLQAGVETRYGLESQEQYAERWAPEFAHTKPQDLTYVATLRVRGSEGKMPRFPNDSSAVPLSFPHLLDDGRLTWREFLSYSQLPNGDFMLNWPIRGNDVAGDYLASGLSRRRILSAAKAKTLALIEALRQRFPDVELVLSDQYGTADRLPPIPYIREARRIRGETTLTLEHMANPFEPSHRGLLRQAIAVGDYPVDHHRREDFEAPHIDFPAIPAFSIPLEALLPERTDGLVAAEKSFSVTGLANGATRLQPVALLVGQAAGTLAALAVTEGTEPRRVATRRVQAVLLDSGAMLMPYRDAPPTHRYFLPLQWAGVFGLLRGEPVSSGWSNAVFIHPDQAYAPSDPVPESLPTDFGFAAVHLQQRLGEEGIRDLLAREKARSSTSLLDSAAPGSLRSGRARSRAGAALDMILSRGCEHAKT